MKVTGFLFAGRDMRGRPDNAFIIGEDEARARARYIEWFEHEPDGDWYHWEDEHVVITAAEEGQE